MKNEGRIIRSSKNGGSRYTAIFNDILQSGILEPEEKSILVHLLSLPQDWIIYKTSIWRSMNIGRDRFNKHWRGLVKKGYIHSVKLTKPNGQFEGYIHEVFEEPFIESEVSSQINRLTEIQLPDIQLPEIQAVNKVITNKVIKEEKLAEKAKQAKQANILITSTAETEAGQKIISNTYQQSIKDLESIRRDKAIKKYEHNTKSKDRIIELITKTPNL